MVVNHIQDDLEAGIMKAGDHLLELAQDVRPAWIPRDLHKMDVDWTEAVKAHPAATKAIKEILLAQ